MLDFGTYDTVLPTPVVVSPAFLKEDQFDLLGLYREIELSAVSTYLNNTSLNTFFGADNIKEWADLTGNKNATEIANRKAAMGFMADDTINAVLRDGPYKIPFIAPFPVTVRNLATRLTGMLLYEHRGLTDSGEQKHELHWHYDYTYKIFNWILARKWRLDYGLTTVRTHLISANGVASNPGALLDEDLQPTPYSVRANVEDIYGLDNPKKWADLDDDGDTIKIASRINEMITLADNEINCRLRAGPYKIPFIVIPYDGMLVNMSARLAGVFLSECRGPTNADKDRNRVQWHREQVDTTINGILAGKYRFDTIKTTPRRRTPIAL